MRTEFIIQGAPVETLTTGQVADKANVNVHTVRYYEKRGLLPKPPRTSSGYRKYAGTLSPSQALLPNLT